MENASKALLMAAGVLMGILVLSLIVYIYATFSDSTQKNMEQMKLNETVAFNSKYLAYDGREDLTYYDIVNIAKMARNDNEENEDQIAVELMRDSIGSGTPENSLHGLPELQLANLKVPKLIKQYNDFVNRINNLNDFNSDQLIMRTLEVPDDITGENKEVKVLTKYKCVVRTKEETGRIDIVEFYRIDS